MALDDKTKQNMESGLEHAVRVVQTRVSQFEQKIVVPSLESTKGFAKRRPITATFISILSLLSFLPVASFLGFIILVTVAFTSVGLACAFVASSVLIIGSAGILALIFSALFFASLFLTFAILTTFVGVRLIQHVSLHSDIRQGFMSWARETRGRIGWKADASSTESATLADASTKSETSAASTEDWSAVNNLQVSPRSS